MKNGGGPARLRLRVALSEAALAAVDPRFLVDAAKIDRLEQLVEQWWPEAIAPTELGNADTCWQCLAAHDALLEGLGIAAVELGH